MFTVHWSVQCTLQYGWGFKIESRDDTKIHKLLLQQSNSGDVLH